MRLLLFVPFVLTACVPLHRDDGQHVQRMCLDRNYAYESGYNVGIERGHLSTSWTNRCAPERAESMRDAYQAGYHQGIANAPIMVKQQHTVEGRHTVSSSSKECTFSSDCGDGRTCRSGTCYGEGWNGAACVFSSDCLSDSCDSSTRTCR